MKYFRSLHALNVFVDNDANLSVLNNTNNFFDIIWGKYKIFTIVAKNTNFINLRIEKLENGLFGTIINAVKKPIGSIDIEKCNKTNKLKIHSYMINSCCFSIDTNNLFGVPVNENDETIIRNILFNFVDNVAKNEGVTKVELDVHKNLKYYKKDNLINYGFIITNQLAEDNPHWIITEKKYNLDE